MADDLKDQLPSVTRDEMEQPDRPPHEYPEDAPYPSGRQQGFILEGGARSLRWGWRFLKTRESTQWFCTFLDQSGGDSTLFGKGPTPGVAFENMVSRWEILNGGPPSRAARQNITSFKEAMLLAGWYEEKTDYGEEA